MFGEGCYFAEDVTKSDQYIDPKLKYIHLIMARVCMGNPWVTTLPCSKRKFPEGYPDECQSTLAELKNQDGEDVRRFREYIIPKGTLSYPEFILTLKRVPRVGHVPPVENVPMVIPNENESGDDDGHILRLPLPKMKNLNLNPGQIARALNEKPEVTVFYQMMETH